MRDSKKDIDVQNSLLDSMGEGEGEGEGEEEGEGERMALKHV